MNSQKLFKNFVFLITILTPKIWAQQSPPNTVDVCVLNFERQAHPFTKIIADSFKNTPDALVIHEAKPIDFLKCLDHNPNELVMVLHSLQMDPKGTRWRWGYFSRVEGQDREKRIKAWTDQVNAELKTLLDNPKPLTHTHMGPNKQLTKVPTAYAKKLNKTKKMLALLENFPTDRVLYDPKPFLNRVFELAQTRAKDNPQSMDRFKSLRIVSCNPEDVLASYDPLVQMIEQQKIHIDFGPLQNLMTWIKGKPVATLDKLWIAESAQDLDQMDDNDFAFVYMNLKTSGFRRRGERLGLRGQYKFKLKGTALGLGQKESMVFIPAKFLKQLQPGETQSFKSPHLDANAALWLNIDLKLLPTPRVQLPSEINSLGASIGFWSNIEVTRLY